MSKQVIVTGAARGLGEAVVNLMVDKGWTVWATDITAESLESSRAHHKVAMDVTDHKAVSEVIGEVAASGGLDALVNNAAIFPLRPWQDHDVEFWRNMLEVNVVGAWVCAQAAATAMVERGVGGSIVNITSLTFYKGHPTGIAYAASKGAVVGMTRSLATALGPDNIRVNAIGPGLMATGGTLELVESGDLPARRLGDEDPDRPLRGSTKPAGVAGGVAFFLSEDAREVTGQVLALDGGSIYL
jgi:pyridoxal 4-dehydrogenase